MTTQTNTYWQKDRYGRGQQLTGVLLVLLGGLWFARQAGWIPASVDGLTLVWPLLTIGGGLTLWLPAPVRAKGLLSRVQRKESTNA